MFMPDVIAIIKMTRMTGVGWEVRATFKNIKIKIKQRVFVLNLKKFPQDSHKILQAQEWN